MEEEIDSEKRIREEMRESFEKEVLDLRERFYADKNLLKAEIRFFSFYSNNLSNKSLVFC